jgi:hypothetical protein
VSDEPWRLSQRRKAPARPPARGLIGDARRDAKLRQEICDPKRTRMLRCVKPVIVRHDGEEYQLVAGRVESAVSPRWEALRKLPDAVVLAHFEPIFWPERVQRLLRRGADDTALPRAGSTVLRRRRRRRTGALRR